MWTRAAACSVWSGLSWASFWAASSRSSSWTSDRSCSDARVAPLDGGQDLGDFAHVGQFTPRQPPRPAWRAIGAGRASGDEMVQRVGTRRWRSALPCASAVWGHCRGTSASARRNEGRCLARFGVIDLRAQAEVPSALRTDTRMARRSRKNRHTGEARRLPSLPKFTEKCQIYVPFDRHTAFNSRCT